MPQTRWVQGQPCWTDLASSDVDRSIDFYQRLFDWEATIGGDEFGGYIVFDKDDRRVAGLSRKLPGNENTPDAWTTYLYSADAIGTAGALTQSGGQNLFEPLAIPAMGSMGYATDPGGAVVGTWQPAGHDGFELLGVPGAPVWHELHTRDFGQAVDFYTRAFAWRTRSLSSSDGFRYQVLVDENDNELAGIFDASASLAPGVPSNWQVYFGVVDTDLSVGKALELGARLTEAPTDSPYGRMAGLIDPTGAFFKISTVA